VTDMKKWLPPLIALVVFVVLLLFFFAVSAASKPPQVTVLAAAHPLKPGDVLTAADLQTVDVYEDARATAYIPVERQQDLVGEVVLQPFDTGEPLTKRCTSAVLPCPKTRPYQATSRASPSAKPCPRRHRRSPPRVWGQRVAPSGRLICILVHPHACGDN